MLPPLCPAVCLQTGQVVLSSVCCSIAFLFPVDCDASPVGVCELLATARAAASIGAIGTLGGAATTSVLGALLLAAVPSTDGDSDKASIEEVLTAQPYCRMPPRQGLLGVRDRGVATLPSGSSPWRRRGFVVNTRSPREARLVCQRCCRVTRHPHCFAYVYDCDMYTHPMHASAELPHRTSPLRCSSQTPMPRLRALPSVPTTSLCHERSLNGVPSEIARDSDRDRNLVT